MVSIRKKWEGGPRESKIEGVPMVLLSLLRAHRLQKRAAQVCFYWEKLRMYL